MLNLLNMTNEDLKKLISLAKDYVSEFKHTEAENILHSMLRNGIPESETEIKIEALLLLSASYRNRHNIQEALSFAKQALDLAENNENGEFNQLLAESLCTIAGVFEVKADYADALEYYRRAIILFEEMDNSKSLSNCLGNIGNVYKAVSDFKQALEYFEKALNICKETGNEKEIARWISAVGIVYQNLGDYPKALEYFSKAHEMIEEHGPKERLATSMGNLGIVYANLKDYDNGLKYLLKALELDAEFGNKSGVARHSGNIGSLYNELADLTKAFEYFRKALTLDEELGNKSNAVVWQGQIASLYANHEFEGYDVIKAETSLLKSLEISNSLDFKQFSYEIHKGLAELYEEQERWKEHSFHYKAYHKLEKQVQSEEVARQVQMLENRRKVEEAERDRQVKLARFQEQEKILHNILPAEIAERILEGEKLIADYCDGVSVFFSDIVDFTKLSEKISPAELVNMLNELFTIFDRIARRHGLEKIKTIGDAYMAVAGVPLPQPDHAERAARFALEVMEAMNEYREKTGNLLEIRAGIHSGHAVAGIIGENKFAYDLWGDAVNTASRMESHGVPGKIQVSDDFKNLLGSRFKFEERGEVEVKGKEKIRTHYLTGQSD